MDTRDRLEEVGRGIDAAKKAGTPVEGRFEDGKDLHSYVSAEELWACTTCNACAEACPVNINPVDEKKQLHLDSRNALFGQYLRQTNDLQNWTVPEILPY